MTPQKNNLLVSALLEVPYSMNYHGENRNRVLYGGFTTVREKIRFFLIEQLLRLRYHKYFINICYIRSD